MSHIQHLFYRHLPDEGKVLEIGCGSGRDAMALVDRGYQVTAVDGSPEMIRQACRIHPTLEGKLIHRAFPLRERDPLAKEHFDAIVSIAVFMHIPDEELFETAYQIRAMLAPGGVLFISVSTGGSLLRDHLTN